MYDKLTIEIPMNEDDVDPFVFAVLRKREKKALHAERHDLSAFASAVPLEFLPQSLVGVRRHMFRLVFLRFQRAFRR